MEGKKPKAEEGNDMSSSMRRLHRDEPRGTARLAEREQMRVDDPPRRSSVYGRVCAREEMQTDEPGKRDEA